MFSGPRKKEDPLERRGSVRYLAPDGLKWDMTVIVVLPLHITGLQNNNPWVFILNARFAPPLLLKTKGGVIILKSQDRTVIPDSCRRASLRPRRAPALAVHPLLKIINFGQVL